MMAQNMPDYFKSSTDTAADKRRGEELTNKIHNKLSDAFSGIGFRSKKVVCYIRHHKEG